MNPSPSPAASNISFTKGRMLPVAGVPFVLPWSFSWAVPCCDKAEAVAGMAEGHKELTATTVLALG